MIVLPARKSGFRAGCRPDSLVEKASLPALRPEARFAIACNIERPSTPNGSQVAMLDLVLVGITRTLSRVGLRLGLQGEVRVRSAPSFEPDPIKGSRGQLWPKTGPRQPNNKSKMFRMICLQRHTTSVAISAQGCASRQPSLRHG